MADGKVKVFAGDGRGKSSAAIGIALREALNGKKCIVIQFLKGRGLADSELLHRLEPEIRVFRFEKCDAADDERTPEQREEEKENIRNGFHYARKCLVTGECDILILDEILGVLDNNFITVDELRNLIELRGETSVILTGRSMPDGLYGSVDDITELKTVRFKNYGTADTAAQTAAQ